MPTIFERMESRAAFPVVINGGTVYVREPTFEEIDRVAAMIASGKGELSNGLTIALLSVHADGTQALAVIDGESDDELAARGLAAAKQLTPSGLRAIQAAVKKLAEPPDPDELAKNSSQTPS